MAERRMFAKTIIDSDAFLDMPQSSQLLYFHLAMRADDDGFINNPKSIMRNVKCSEDDLKLLILKKFLIPFNSGVVVIKHWRIHNYIRGDRYKETKYKEEKSTLFLDENNAYTRSKNNQVYQMDTNGIPTVDQMDTNGIPTVDQMDTQYGDTQVRLGKDSIELGKDSIGKDRLDLNNESIVNSNTPPLPPSRTDNSLDSYRKLFDVVSSNCDLSETILASIKKWLNYKYKKGYAYDKSDMAELLELVSLKANEYGDESVCTVISESITNGFKGIAWSNIRKKNDGNGTYHNRTAEMLQDSYNMMSEWVRKKEMEESENDN